ncbi:unnamed protein product [Auanema sp. JU1783]|nr:unnamed protein product [Auanema sp. JU1783]
MYMSEYGATCDYSISTYSYKQQKKTNKLAKKPENSKKSSSTNLDYISAFCDSKRAQSSANPQDAISSEGSQSPTSTNYSRKDEQFIDNYLLEANFIDKLVESGFAEMENSQLYMITED